MKKYNFPLVFLYAIIFLIPFYRVQIQYNFQLYIGIAYFIYLVSTNNFLIKTSKNLSLKTYAGFYIWTAFSTFFSVNFDYSFQYLINYLFISIFFLLAVHYINSFEKVIIATKIIVASMALQIFIVYMQYVGVKSFYMNDVNNLGLNTGMTENSTGIVRYWGSFGEALVLSTYLTTIGVGLSIYLLSKYKNNLFTYIVIFTILFSIYLTGSRAGISIFLLMITVFVFRSRIFKNPITVAVLFLLVLVGYYYFDFVVQSNANLARFSQLKEGDIRFELWTKGFSVLTDSPWVGSSIGCLNYSLKKYQLLPDYVTTINSSGHVENSYLTVLFSVGIIGFIFFLGLVKYPFDLIRKYHLNKLPEDVPFRILLRASTYSYTALLICMFTEPSVGVHTRNTVLFMLANALICCLANIYIREQHIANSKYISSETNSYSFTN